jgi:hypothetical protein
MAVDEADSIIGGWESSHDRGPRTDDREWYARAAVDTPGVRELLGTEWTRWSAIVEEHCPN